MHSIFPEDSKAPYVRGFFLFLLSVAFLARVMPHVPNSSLLPALCLFGGSKFSLRQACGFILVTLFLSDILLSYFYGYPAFGSWTFFTYTGFVLTVFMGKLLRDNVRITSFAMTVCSSTLVYWLWTNFGVWLVDGVYPHSMSGFLSCYEMALPFLRVSLLSSLLWSAGVFLPYLFLIPLFQRGVGGIS